MTPLEAQRTAEEMEEDMATDGEHDDPAGEEVETEADVKGFED